MPVLTVGDLDLHYEQAGSGPSVVLVPGTGARGRTWWLHQVPALVAAGYRVVTVDNRGAGSPHTGPLTVGALVGDLALFVERVAGGPCRLVGSSMGAHLVQELLVSRPDLAVQAVLMASRARPDALSRALTAAEKQLYDNAVTLPPGYAAVVRAMQNLSPRTLADPQRAQDWLEIFELSPAGDAGARAQLDLDWDTDRRDAYRTITAPTLVVSFADDLVTPAPRGRELADCIPRARYAEIPDSGHYGYLEQPDAVNDAVLAFFKEFP
ncbi:alpha/beta fold hydrolase [Micromonospora sp. NPDC051300]|uniref:alpha/beta fold hydrolase n=1 Tax=Micromonospora sp. NPDC051300 TaxID=3364286 RepID=UPI00379FE8DE